MIGTIRRLAGVVAVASTLHVSLDTTAFAQVTPPPTGDVNRPSMTTDNRFQLNATSNSNQATLNLTGRPLPTGSGDTLNWSLTLSSPITMGSDSSGGASATNTKIATLDGLANGFQGKFKLGFFRILAEPTTAAENGGNATTDRVMADAVNACHATQAYQLYAINQKLSQQNKQNQPAPANAGQPNAAQNPCDNSKNQGTFIWTYARDEYSLYEMQLYQPHNGFLAWTAGAQAALGYNQFTFYTAKTLVKSTQDSEPWSAGVYAGVMPGLGNWVDDPGMITFAANYQNVYKAQTSQTMCANGTSGINCATGSFGAPTHTEKYLLSIDWAQQFLIPISAKTTVPIGIDPLVTYDAKAGKLGVDVPIYFISNSSGSLIGGLDVGWTAEKNAFSIGVFVGVPFGLFSSGS